MMFEEENLAENLLPAVEQQLESKDTPYVMKTFKRLVERGEEEAEAKLMIAYCLADESDKMYSDRRDFDVKRYQELLAEL